MNRIERTLLENLLDCLDRLFDCETNVIDVRDLVYATHAALSETNHASVLAVAEKALISIVRSDTTSDQKRDTALVATDELRVYLATILPTP